MSHVDPGPLATYESLADPHLTGYFNNTRMRKHLKRMGLITRRGEIVSEKVFRLNNARKEHQRHIRDVLAQAIVHKALDMERHRQVHIKRQLEEIAKIERVRRVRAERALRGDEDILPLLSPRAKQQNKRNRTRGKVPILQTVTDSEEYEQMPPQSVGYPAMPEGPPYNTRTDRIKMQYPNVEVDNHHLAGLDRDALRSFTVTQSQFDLGSGVSPYLLPKGDEKYLTKKKSNRRPASSPCVPARMKIRTVSHARSLKLHRKEPPMMHKAQVHTLTRVTFKYLGQMVHLDHEEEDPRDEVVVMQQHCGGENIRIFKGMVMQGDKFVVISRRHRSFPFSLTFYLNGVQVERLSTCCEYKHKTGHKLGARSSHFGIMKIEGSQPCFKCLISQGKPKTRPDPTPPSSGVRSQPTNPRRNKKKAIGNKKEQDTYHDSGSESSKSSTTTDEVQTDGPKVRSDVSSSEVSPESSPLTSENDDSDSDTSSDSNLPSLKHDYSDTSDTESIDSQIKINDTSVKSPKTRAPSANKIKKKLPPNEKKNKPQTIVSTQPTITKASTSPPVHILEVQESVSASSSDNDHDNAKLTTESESSDSMTEPRNAQSNISADEGKTGEPSDKQNCSMNSVPSASQQTKNLTNDAVPPFSSESDTLNISGTYGKGKILNASILPLVVDRSLVDLKDRKLTSAHIEELVTYFYGQSSTQIQELNFANCEVGDSYFKVLFRSISQLSSLKTLDISGNRLSHDCVQDILLVCQKTPLENLHLSNNPLDDIGCNELLFGLMKSQQAIVTAKVQKKLSQSLIASVLQDTRKEMSEEVASSMSSASSMTSLASSAVNGDSISLKTLDLSYTGAGHESFIRIGVFLSLDPTLSLVNLSGNSITMKGVENIIRPLSDDTNKNLRSLFLDNTTLSEEMVEVITDQLMMKSKLTTLSVKGNQISEYGKRKLEEYRNTNSSLHNLYMD